MSGIVGIVAVDGAPVDERVLRRMTAGLRYRGPDGTGVWSRAGIGLGHTLLQCTDDADARRQPESLDARTWITADARLDGREGLIRELEGAGHDGAGRADDARLILYAYRAWGTACVQHLTGDFAFAIWDGRKGLLFCARDHFGVKPFYFARLQDGIIISNTLDCVRMHPGVSGALDEMAVGDFLVFGASQEPTATVFAGVRRLPAAHTLTFDQHGVLRTARYWSLPVAHTVRYRRAHEYVDHFVDVFRTAVADRVTSDRVGVLMSGGLDSTSICATAYRVLSARGRPFDLRAHTVVYDELIRDEERHFANLTSRSLGIQNSFFVADAYGPFDRWNEPGTSTPEPTNDPFFPMRHRQLREAAQYSRVMLCGEGGDEAFRPSYAIDLLSRLPLADLAADLTRALVIHRKRPPLGVRAKLQQRIAPRTGSPRYPGWLHHTFAERHRLWTGSQRAWTGEPAPEHQVRREAHERLTMPAWSAYCESSDPGATRAPVELRYPFLDVRLVGYVMALPPLPWCVDKHILRQAMRGLLPEPIRRRRKAPLPEDPLRAHVRASGMPRRSGFDLVAELMPYVDLKAHPVTTGDWIGADPWTDIRLLCLNKWLTRIREEESRRGEANDDEVDEIRRCRAGEEAVRESAT